MKKILFVASECVPFVKTGGLADVVGALPAALDREQYDVRVVIPNYRCIKPEYRKKFYPIAHFYMDLGGLGDVYVGVMGYEHEGVRYYFIDNEHYFSGEKPYGDLQWDIEKFCFFSKAALAILPVINFHPDIIHCHDWQAGLVPVYLHTLFKPNPFFHGIRTVMTIHNLRFQGVWDIDTIAFYTGLPHEVFTPDRLEYHQDANMLKGGLVYADRITTVSRTYAEEIRNPYYGEGLDGLLRARADSLSGIVNGVDYAVYDPATDKKLPKNYTADTVREGKIACKTALQQELGLVPDPNRMMIAMVTRLTDQKGLDLLAWIMDTLLGTPVQLVIVGTGDAKYENMMRHYEWLHQGQVSANIMFDDGRARRIYAAADLMLMPSQFEPCGLTQLISMHYGTLPLVRETGGLRDTVQPYNEYEGTGTGFSFTRYNADDMLYVLLYAQKLFYHDRAAWDAMVQRAMHTDFSWNTSAREYEALYESL